MRKRPIKSFEYYSWHLCVKVHDCLPVLIGTKESISLQITFGNRKYFGCYLVVGGRQTSSIRGHH